MGGLRVALAVGFAAGDLWVAALASVFRASDLRGAEPVAGFAAEDLPLTGLAGVFRGEDLLRLVPRGGVSEATDFASRAFRVAFTGVVVFSRFDAGRADCFVEERGSRAGLMGPGL
ncbi:hypothetical protein LXT21_10610 [Myxococcus sp. K38C18041901]|uniref:hypothetical protein n=1 Tax=Myxococcus guangdongensis TaxID=2906760 RepID=UPI0020A70C4C|nr:hypothetical protein [Myxococcus guangdongensis]MCP3059224.1 hypothetical protein [Myxococcus guangdongensis]